MFSQMTENDSAVGNVFHILMDGVAHVRQKGCKSLCSGKTVQILTISVAEHGCCVLMAAVFIIS